MFSQFLVMLFIYLMEPILFISINFIYISIYFTSFNILKRFFANIAQSFVNFGSFISIMKNIEVAVPIATQINERY